ncbi:MAG: flagellar type III secretion system pore protein FliP [Planctomycetota bacterium]
MNLLFLAETVASDPFKDLAPPLQVALLLGALSFATAALVSLTAFTRIIIVLSFVRRALSTTEIPPNQVMLGLAFFLTLFVMAPTFEKINNNAIQPYLKAQAAADKATESAESLGVIESAESAGVAKNDEATFGLRELFENSAFEIRQFITVHTRVSDIELFVALSNEPEPESIDAIPMIVLIPAFIISELKTAFIMGFCIYIPFLLIDLVVSTALMSLGMMMMPPVIVSTPCKLLLFVLVDGWQLISKSLVGSFVV